MTGYRNDTVWAIKGKQKPHELNGVRSSDVSVSESGFAVLAVGRRVNTCEVVTVKFWEQIDGTSCP